MTVFLIYETACCHHAAMMGQEHSNGCMGCLAFQLQGSMPPVMMTVFLTLEQHATNKNTGD